MTERVLKDWIPGVLSKRQLTKLCDSGHIVGEDSIAEQAGKSSIDLSIGARLFKTTRGSVKPNGKGYLRDLLDHHLAEDELPDKDGAWCLEPRQTYVIELREKLDRLHDLIACRMNGQATAKSSIGRLDVLARLVVDGVSTYEGFTHECLQNSSGEMWLEVTPMTFPIRVRPGNKLTQLRLFIGTPKEAEIPSVAISGLVLDDTQDGTLSVNLTPTTIEGKRAVAFSADRIFNKDKPGDYNPIDLSLEEEHGAQPGEYWEIENIEDHSRFTIRRDRFYILRSKERIRVPKGVAVYCRAIDEAIGEMRIHYAGFAHPFFGLDRKDGQMGTPLIFEVRGHDVDVSLADGEKMAKLIFYRMSEDASEDDHKPTVYGEQTLKLSKHFRSWSKP